ncbi:MAG: prolyl oligopeptidase family serine peptidase [Verrucomicrobiota bacterium]
MMKSTAIHRLIALCLFSPIIGGIATGADYRGTKTDYERSAALGRSFADKVFKDRITPHWLEDQPRFWYRNDVRGKREFILVDAEVGIRQPAFDHQRLATQLTAATGETFQADALPFDRVAFLTEPDRIRFRIEDADWTCDLESYECTRVESPAATQPSANGRGDRPERRGRRGGRGGGGSTQDYPSPDRAYIAFIREHNVFARETGDGTVLQLSQDGVEGDAYSGPILWSADSQKLAVFKVKAGEERLVHYIDAAPDDQLQPKHFTRVYPKPGDVIETRTPCVFTVGWYSKRMAADTAQFPNPFNVRELRWRDDGSAVVFEAIERGFGYHRVLELSADSGLTRVVISEESNTFVDAYHKGFRHDLDDGAEIVWASERDGWNHLYLYDGRTGKVINQVTQGPWVFRGVESVDEEKRQVWFRACGREPGQDPYFIHYYRINLDGTDIVRLTEGDGTHSVQFSPDRRFLIDSYSRVDLAPVHTLRRSCDGSLVCHLETADITDLQAAGWKAPEAFTAKDRDGGFDIYGLIFRPLEMDPNKVYPVIEQIYAGPQDSFVPKAFQPFFRMQALAELGFIVVKIDGKGTSNRSRAFHHFCYKNLADAGIPDRIAWMQAAAAKYPEMDLERVGVYGGSAGGQSALGALLQAPEFYKVAVADCGCHDNRMDKIWWNELWMDWPVGPHYAEQSNVTMAHRLQGKLFLTVGELDTNVDPASTMQVVDALIKADKDFDLLIVPGANHGIGESPYADRRRSDFFVRHLLEVEPRQ